MLDSGAEVSSLGRYGAGADLAGAELGDVRRSRRLAALADMISTSPSSSLPALLSTAELEAAYRLMSNPNVTPEAVLDAHAGETARRCRDEDVTLVLHDTSEVSFALRDDQYREHLSRLSSRRQGFHVHLSLAVSGDGSRRPLGVIASRNFVHASQVVHDAGSLAWWQGRDGVLDNENDRWFQGVEAAELALEQVSSRVIHVADREGDSYEFVASMIELGREFVVRLNHDRQILDDDEEVRQVSDSLSRVPFLIGTRVVELSPRTATRSAKALRTHPARRGRNATLSFRSSRVTLRRPAGASIDYLPEYIDVNIVEAVEVNPPGGEAPVRWLLVTNTCCEDIDDLFRVVDWYRARWTIEEFFKGLKTGCSYEKRQFSSAHALLNMLALTLPVALQLLCLRHASRYTPDTPASTFLTGTQLTLLAALRPKARLTSAPTVHEALMAIAKLGGHLKRNGPPGWLILYRGYTKLIHAEEGWRAMRGLATEM